MRRPLHGAQSSCFITPKLHQPTAPTATAVFTARRQYDGWGWGNAHPQSRPFRLSGTRFPAPVAAADTAVDPAAGPDWPRSLLRLATRAASGADIPSSCKKVGHKQRTRKQT